MLPIDREILKLLARKDYDGAISLYANKYEVGDERAKSVVSNYLIHYEQDIKKESLALIETEKKDLSIQDQLILLLRNGHIEEAVDQYKAHYKCSEKIARQSINELRVQHFPKYKWNQRMKILYSWKFWLGIVLIALLLFLIGNR